MVSRRTRSLVALLAGVAIVAGAVLFAESRLSVRRAQAKGTPETRDEGSSVERSRQPKSDTSLMSSLYLAWVPGGLPAGFDRAARAVPGIERVVSVASGTAWLTRSFAPDGVPLDRPPAGFAIPVDVAASEPSAYAPLLAPRDRSLLSHLTGPRALLGESASKLRGVGVGGRLIFGSTSLLVAGVVPDTAIGGHELFASRRTAATLGVKRAAYLLVELSPAAPVKDLQAELRSLLPPGSLLRVRAPGQTPYLREADAVLPLIKVKQLLGEFAARKLTGGLIELDPNWVAGHIVETRLPIIGRVSCNRALIPQLEGALDEVVRIGLSRLIRPSDFGGCFSSRFINHDSAAGLSRHAWGGAVDINVSTNQVGQRPQMDPRVVAIFERWGFTWGGRWLRPDGMHFEVFDIRNP